MIEVRRKVSDSTAELGTLLDIQGMVIVLGAVRATVKELGDQGIDLLPREAYASADLARRDGWMPV